MTKTLPERIRVRVRDTGQASRLAVSRLDALAVAGLVAAAYLAGYLWSTDRLSVRAGLGGSVTVVDEPLARAFERTGQLQFEPVALVDLWVVRLLVSPIDVLVGATIAGLVGLNLALAYLALVQPRSCGLGAGAGAAASVPALLSGTVCCAPVIVIALGVQVSGTLLTVLPWLLPLGVVLLLGSLVYVGGLVDTENGRRVS
ncbi:hypothetical protein QA600_07110 [Natronococcus sp. A-GB1]|uniref:hypothetical protein n=1 Tax=Natronococcus sp. A-GB1 TaxID=3037648 RepID=UPI0024200BCE|nr:hypothetical protein [Natronococcus sp. A-GB1]MDG5759107.1 hypothetical protein [Natronococcus sp. A-GB1]